MHSTKRRLCCMLAVVLLAPLWAVAQPRPREARPDKGTAQGPIHVTNNWRDEVSLSMWSDQRERIGEWWIRPGEEVVLQEGGERIKVRPNYKMKVGDHSGWVDVRQVGEFQNGTWYVNVRDVWQATQRDNPRDSDNRRSKEEPRREEPRRQESSEEEPRREEPRREQSPVDQILKNLR